ADKERPQADTEGAASGRNKSSVIGVGLALDRGSLGLFSGAVRSSSHLTGRPVAMVWFGNPSYIYPIF
ncbi:hypothetical protein Q4508_18525, partial [Amphritea sp. 2_MG-2023]|uniref:hypothetical protein n=1 Tax=Amphritea sp. 2_MG-2023 TaxID=3062682 RepID=UPI0026E3A104